MRSTVRVPGLVSIPQLSYRMSFSSVAVTEGVDTNRNTAGNFNRITGNIIVYAPLLVTALVWDVRNDGIYTCQFVDGITSTTPVFILKENMEIVGGADIDVMATTGDFVLLPGEHFLQLAKSGDETTWNDYDSETFTGTNWLMNDLRYEATDYKYVLPIKMTTRKATFADLHSYAHPGA